jgi:hypothetical protein
MRKHLYRNLVLVILLLSPMVSSAKFPGFFSHLEIGYSYPMATAKFEGYNPVYNYSGSGDFGIVVGDTFVTRNVTSKFAYGTYIGSSIRLKRTGVKTALALHIDLMANVYVWEDLYKAFSSFDGMEYDFPDQTVAIGYQLGLPMTLDYKIGAGALGSRASRFTGSIGAGIFPAAYFMVAESNGNVGGGMSFTASPVIKGELGVVAGICIKVRGLVAFGPVPWIDNNKSFLASSTGGFKVTGQTTAVFSVVLMPFSWTWRKEGWWDNDFKYSNY